jgi:hypothetical protein
MFKVVFAAWLLMTCSLSVGKDLGPLALQKGARVGIVNLLDPEVTYFHNAKELTQRVLKTFVVNWQVDSMVSDAVAPRLNQLGLVAVPLAPSDAILHSRTDTFVNNSVAKGLPREAAKSFAELAAAGQVAALIVLAPGLNNSSQAGGLLRRDLPDYLRGWGYVTADAAGKPSIFNMTQLLLIAITADGATLQAREWGGGFADEWPDYSAPADPKLIPAAELDKLQPLFLQLLIRQAAPLLDRITVPAG